MRLSVIIPTFNEEKIIARTLREILLIDEIDEIIVADGGSADATAEIIKNFRQIKLVEIAPANRGRQLDAGARAATGDVFWFVHADTIPAANAAAAIKKAMRDQKIIGGNFRIRFDGGGFWAAILTGLYPRLRKLNLIYGDSAIFVRREVFEQMNGFGDLPLFEDVDFFRRARRCGRFRHADEIVTTSSRRFENSSFVLTFAEWSIFQGLYWLGFSPRRLAKWYKVIR